MILLNYWSGLKPFFHCFFATSFAPPHMITTSFLVRLGISLFTEVTRVSTPAPGLINPWTWKFPLIWDFTFCAHSLAWLSPMITILWSFLEVVSIFCLLLGEYHCIDICPRPGNDYLLGQKFTRNGSTSGFTKAFFWGAPWMLVLPLFLCNPGRFFTFLVMFMFTEWCQVLVK